MFKTPVSTPRRLRRSISTGDVSVNQSPTLKKEDLEGAEEAKEASAKRNAERKAEAAKRKEAAAKADAEKKEAAGKAAAEKKAASAKKSAAKTDDEKAAAKKVS